MEWKLAILVFFFLSFSFQLFFFFFLYSGVSRIWRKWKASEFIFFFIDWQHSLTLQSRVRITFYLKRIKGRMSEKMVSEGSERKNTGLEWLLNSRVFDLFFDDDDDPNGRWRGLFMFLEETSLGVTKNFCLLFSHSFDVVSLEKLSTLEKVSKSVETFSSVSSHALQEQLILSSISTSKLLVCVTAWYLLSPDRYLCCLAKRI